LRRSKDGRRLDVIEHGLYGSTEGIGSGPLGQTQAETVVRRSLANKMVFTFAHEALV